MKKARALGVTASALVTLAAVIGPGPSASADVGDEQVCRAVVEPAAAGDIYPSSPPRTNVGFRLRCNFRVTDFSFRTSKPLERVYERPKLERPDPEDRLRCGSLSGAVGKCSGEVGEQVRVLGALKVKGGACGAKRLRTQFRVRGGEDCDAGDQGCPGIGYEAVVRVEQPVGC